jgi:hypothetical protein
MQAHVAERPQHRYGVHRYELADFGLDRGELSERYATYIERFDVATSWR